MKRNFIFIITIISIAAGFFNSCTRKSHGTIGLAFYNVENLFDTIDDPTINDESYLPDSKTPWNTQRYEHKLDNIAKVIASIDSSGFPTLVGLSEVENEQVLHDLVANPRIKQAGYSILHKDSPDERGIDVALLYQDKLFHLVKTNYIRFTFPWDPENKTRDILYTKGVVGNNDTLHVFINHWVSRWGGQEATEPARRYIGKTIGFITDSIFSRQPDANIVIAGDLNDNPTDKSVLADLGAVGVNGSAKGKTLYNLSYNIYKEGQGSLYYKGWDMFDQIIVSSALLKGSNGIQLESEEQTVVKYDWMLYHPKNGPARPNRTASGGKYFGGYSDHLPVFIEIAVN